MECNSKGQFTLTVSVSVIVKVYHCVNGDGLFEVHIGFGTHSAYLCKFDSDRDGEWNGDRTCKRTFTTRRIQECRK